jgi:hypothetical protein
MVKQFLTIVAAAGLIVGCSSEVQLNVTVSDPCNQSVLAATEHIEITVYSQSEGVSQAASWSKADGGGQLPPVPLMSDAVVSVTTRASDSSGAPGAAIAGATIGSIDLSGIQGATTTDITVIPGKVDTFANTTNAADPRQCTELIADRRDHTATLLPDGRVAIVGGVRERGNLATFWETTEVFDPVAGTFSKGPDLEWMRRGHRATTLSDGNIFYTGGKWRYVEADGQTVNTQIWRLALTLDSETLQFGTPVTLRDPRAYHSATLLSDGRVLLAGGTCDPDAPATERDPDDPCNELEPENVCVNGYLVTTEIYDPTTGEATCGPNLLEGRAHHNAVKVGASSIALIGGRNETGVIGTIEFITVGDSSGINAANSLTTPRSHMAALLVPNQNAIFVAGGISAAVSSPENGVGLQSVEIISLNRSNLSLSTVICAEPALQLTQARGAPGFALVAGRALLAGGITENGEVTRSAEMVTFGNLSECSLATQVTTGNLSKARASTELTTLLGGDVLITGGVNFEGGEIGTVGAGEIYTTER